MDLIDQRTVFAPATFSTPGEVESFWVARANDPRGLGFVRDGVATRELLETGATVSARVDHGRWLADCVCGGALSCWDANPRGCCLDCGRVYRVKFPPKRSRDSATALLLARPLANRNWSPESESVAALKAENASASELGLIA